MAQTNYTKSSSEPALPTEGVLHDSAGLEFPDWSGMAPHLTRMNFEEACRWNEDMLELFSSKPGQRDSEHESRCLVPFVL